MAQVARGTDVSPDASTAMLAPQVPDGIAGAAIDAGAPCHIKGDGLVYMSSGAQAGAAATAAELVTAGFVGFAAKATPAGQAVTLFGLGTRFRYGSGLTPGANYYVDTAAGRLNDAATTLGTYIVAKAAPNGMDVIVAATPR